MSLLLGIDVSTTGAKSLIIDGDGEVLAAATTPLNVSAPRPLWSEQDPESWWRAVVSSIRRALAQASKHGGRVAAIGLTGQMHGLVLLDEHEAVLRPAILWNDQRCGAECDDIRALFGIERLVEVTGNDALTGFTAPKILWVQKNEPEIYARVRHILLPKDYIRLKLTGAMAMDKADGSGTMLFDLKARDWSSEVLRALNISRDWLPRTYEGPEVTGEVSGEAAAATGLSAGTPVVAGGGDQAAQATGVGAVRSGVVALTLGTSGVVFAATESPLVDPRGRLHSFCHSVPGRWHLMCVMLSAAGSLQWYRDSLAPRTSFEDLMAEAEGAPAGSQGLLFLPYLTGERTPYADPLARAAMVGLTARHGRAHMTRAVLEGVAFGLRDSFELIKGAGLGALGQVRVSGGGARSLLWRQILADVLGVELVSVNTTEGAAYGAALLAGVGNKTWPDVDTACLNNVRTRDPVSPREKTMAVYEELYPHYRNLYASLKPTFDGLSELDV
ncbi:MAG: xylulokinase [Blastocatellia bacterium]